MIDALIEKCWRDPEFKKHLIENPATVLTREGIDLPAEWTVVVHENTAEIMHLILPSQGQIAEAQWKRIGKPLAALITRIWDDPSFAARISEQPKEEVAALTGIRAPADIALAIHCNTPRVRHFVIPVEPGTDDLLARRFHEVVGAVRSRRLGR